MRHLRKKPDNCSYFSNGVAAFSLLEIEDDSPFSKIVVNCPVPSITNTLILRFGYNGH